MGCAFARWEHMLLGWWCAHLRDKAGGIVREQASDQDGGPKDELGSQGGRIPQVWQREGEGIDGEGRQRRDGQRVGQRPCTTCITGLWMLFTGSVLQRRNPRTIPNHQSMHDRLSLRALFERALEAAGWLSADGSVGEWM